MTSSNNHLIRSVRFDTAADVEASASTFADAVSAIDYQLVFGKVLEQYDNIPEALRLDRLELDLGHIDINDLDDLEATIARLLDEALAEQLPAAYQQAAISGQAWQPVNRKKGVEAADDSGQALYSPAEQIDILVYYFRTGMLPWNVTIQPDIVQLLLEAMKAAPGLLKQRFLPVFLHIAAIRRIVYALPGEVRTQLLALYTEPVNLASVEKVAGILLQEMPASQRTTFAQQLAIVYFKTVGKGSTSQALFVEAVLTELQQILRESSAYITEATYQRILLLRQQETSPVYQRMHRPLLVQLADILIAKGEWAQQPNDIVDATIIPEDTAVIDEQVQPAEENTPDTQMEDRVDADDETLGEQALFIDNSGLVLVASFLPVAFKKLGWVAEGKIVDTAARDKMLLWMDHLVWGERKAYEYNLSFNKVLAGIPPQEVVDISLLLTDEEKAVADSLLESVILHWSILKNTSIDGLRGSFLQRNGKMHNEDGGWQLHVQSKPFDMLLDHLPWGISIIKFSWMEKPVYTQWRTKT